MAPAIFVSLSKKFLECYELNFEILYTTFYCANGHYKQNKTAKLYSYANGFQTPEKRFIIRMRYNIQGLLVLGRRFYNFIIGLNQTCSSPT